MANYRYTYEYGGRRYEIEAPKGATAADLQAIVDGSGRAAAPAPAAAKPKPKKKEDESFLSGVIPTLKAATGDIVTLGGRALEVFSRAPFISSTGLLQGVSPKPSDNILRRAVESAGASARSTGQGITKRAIAELPEASVEDRLRQKAEVANATPGIGSDIFYRISKSLATPSPNPTLLDYGISTLARNLLPQTPERAARELAKVQAPFGTSRGAAEFIASQVPASLIPLGGGKIAQVGGRAILPRLGVEVSEEALKKAVGRGVVTAGGGINAASAGNQAYEDVINAGGTKEEADRAFKIAFAGAAAVSGAAARMPGLEQRVFSGEPTKGGILRSAGRAAIGEAPQEFVEEGGATLATNVAKLGTEAEVPIGEDVLSSGAMGAIGGATIAAPIGGLQGAFSGRDAGPTAPTSGAARQPRTPPPPPPPPADMGVLAEALGPVGGKVILQEPTGPQEYTFEGFDEDGSVVLSDADGVLFSEDPDQIQAAIKAGVAEPESGLGGMAFGMDITEGLGDVTAPPPPPPPPTTGIGSEPKPKFTIETAQEEAAREAKAAIKSGAVAPPVFSPDVAPPIFSPPAGKPKFTIEIPPPEPRNTEGKSQVGKVIFDQENGVGQVPLNQSVNYRGFTAMMRPSKFLELAADLEAPKKSSVEYIRKAIDQGKGVGSPFLNLDFETGKVDSHDGRHRMLAILEKNGDAPVPVHIFGKGEQRARSLDEGKINSFASSMTGEDGRQSSDNFSEAFLDEVSVPVSAAAPVQEPVQEPVAEEPELPPPPPERVRTVTTPGGSKINTAFEVVDAKDLTAATGDLQNRDRSRSSTDLQVQDIFAKFDPERLGESLESDRGSPIVGPDNTVESGNGRVMAINKVYNESPEKADAYRKFIEGQGFDISGLDRPVLVRRRTDRMTPDQRSKFVRESNMDTKLQLSTSEKAQTDAASLTPDVMALMASPDVSASANQGFVRAFLSKLPAQEQAAFLDKDGRLSADGIRRLRTAVKSAAYGDADLINTLDESQDNNIKSIGGALEDVAPAWRRMLDAIKEGEVEPEMDTTKQLVEAAKIVRDVRNKNMKIGDFLSQQDAFNPLNPVTERFIRSFYNETLGRAAGREAIADALDKYVRRASEQTTGEGLFGRESMSPVEILDGILDERGSGAGQSNMYASIEAPSGTLQQDIEEIRKIPSLKRGLAKLIKYKDEQLIDDAEFAKQVTDLKDYVDYMQEAKNYRLAKKGRVRGGDRVLSALLDARREGVIDPDNVDLMMWALNANPNLADGLAISIVKPKEGSPAGDYEPVTRVMRLFKGRASDTTAVHELLHHTERMMPADIQDAIRTTWLREFNKQAEKSKDNFLEKEFFKHLRAFHSGSQIKMGKDTLPSSKGMELALNSINNGFVPYSFYQYVNPSEFWAVNATEIMQKRFDVSDSILGRLRNWLSEFVEKAKGLFNLSAKSPLLKALDSLAKADGKFNSKAMLSEDSERYMDVTPISDARNRSILAKAQAVVDKGSAAKLREVEDTLDALDDVYSSDDENAKKEADRLEESLYNMERQIREKSRPSNDNKLETEVEKAQRKYDAARKAFDNLFYSAEDERANKDRRTKERKAYEKELDQLEAAKDEAFVKWDKLYRQETEEMMKALTNGTAAQMRNAVAKAQERTDKVIDEGADLQKDNRGCD